MSCNSENDLSSLCLLQVPGDLPGGSLHIPVFSQPLHNQQVMDLANTAGRCLPKAIVNLYAAGGSFGRYKMMQKT